MNDDQFGKLKWDDPCWEGKVTFDHLGTFGKALDERDPPDPKPPLPAEKGPTKAQTEAKAALQGMIAQASGEESDMLKMLMGFTERMAEARNEPASEEDQEPSEEELELREGTVTLYIDMEGKRAKPTKPQRAAWESFLARGDKFWDELLKEAVKVYQRQRPMRVKLWKRSYGDYLLDRRLPEVKTAAQMKRLIRLVSARIKNLPEGVKSPDISLHIMTTWDCDGFGVIVRDGKIVKIGPVLALVHTPARPTERIEHPVFGVLERIPDDDPFEVIDQWKVPKEDGQSGFDGAKTGGPWPWDGKTPFDPMLEFSYSADERAKYMRDRAKADRPESRMAWEFADGQFDLRVSARRGEQPSQAQAQAFATFRAKSDAIAKEMIQTIFDQYLETFDARRAYYKDRYVEDVIPEISKPEQLRDLMQLRHIHVHEGQRPEDVTIAFQLVCSFDYDGVTALVRDGKIAEWGTWDDARPKD